MPDFKLKPRIPEGHFVYDVAEPAGPGASDIREMADLDFFEWLLEARKNLVDLPALSVLRGATIEQLIPATPVERAEHSDYNGKVRSHIPVCCGDKGFRITEVLPSEPGRKTDMLGVCLSCGENWKLRGCFLASVTEV